MCIVACYKSAKYCHSPAPKDQLQHVILGKPHCHGPHMIRESSLPRYYAFCFLSWDVLLLLSLTCFPFVQRTDHLLSSGNDTACLLNEKHKQQEEQLPFLFVRVALFILRSSYRVTEKELRCTSSLHTDYARLKLLAKSFLRIPTWHRSPCICAIL